MTLVPFESIFAKIATTVAIDIGAKSNADKLARAQAALKVSAIFQTASTGDLATSAQQLEALLTGSTADPGVAQVISDLANVGNVFLQAKLAVVEATPLLGSEITAIAGNVATGMASIAQAYITKYTPATSAGT
jgi:hypothetical protein